MDFKEKVYFTSSTLLGFVKRKHQDWFDENDEEDKKRMLNKTLISTGSEVEIAHNTLALKDLKSDIQKRLRVMKNVWWESKAHKLQTASDRKDSKKVYNLLKQVYGPTKSSFCSISSKDGSQSFRQPDEIRKRWCEHYNELLNRFSVVDDTFINQIE